MASIAEAPTKQQPSNLPEAFLRQLDQAVNDRDGTTKGDETTFTCPFPDHVDKHPSARWNVKKGAFYCLTCGEGGGALELADLLGIEKPKRKGEGESSTPSPKRLVHSYTPNLTVSILADAKGIDEGFLRSLGVSDVTYRRGKAVRIAYHAPDGTVGAVRYRTHLQKPPSGDRFTWKGGTKARLYGLDGFGLARSAGYVWLVEGESCRWTCLQAGEPCVAVPGAGNWRDDRDAQHFDDVDAIYVVIEPDRGGETLRKKMMESSIRERVHFVDLSEFGVKDVSDLYLADRERFRERLEQAKGNAVPLANIATKEADQAIKDAYECAYGLVYESDILRLVRDAMQARGYAGSLDAPLMAYVGITSRILSHPLNMAFIAPSGAGKNRAIDEGRAFVGAEAVYEIKAGSARALIYNDASFEHRVVLFSEADSIPEEGPAASAIRSIASDNEMAYEIVERDESTGQWGVRIIKKPGPTALMTTSTRSLRNQFDTRVLEIPIPDDADQTRAVMRAHAASVMPSGADDIDLGSFIALQRWLQLAGEKRVAVPFAETLAGLLPAGAVRMRRDFRQLLTAVQAIACLHQCTRERTAEGWVVSIVADYASARTLLAPIFDVSTSEGVTPPIREVVAAIGETEELPLSTLATRLNLAKTTVSWRTSRAVKGGWLVNNETRRGQPAKFARGTPLPDEVSALPTRAALLSAYECTSDSGEDRDTLPPHPPDNVTEIHREPLAATGTGWEEF